MQLALRAPDGELLVQNVAPFYMDAAPPLPDTTLQRTNYQLELPDSLPPGMYELLVGSWDYADETGSGEWEPLLEVEIAGSSAESDPNTGLHFANGLHLVDVISTEAVKPGHPPPSPWYGKPARRLPTACVISSKSSITMGMFCVDGGVVDHPGYPQAISRQILASYSRLVSTSRQRLRRGNFRCVGLYLTVMNQCPAVSADCRGAAMPTCLAK